MKNEIINEINNAALKRNSMSWQARATIVAALVMAVASVVVAYIR